MARSKSPSRRQQPSKASLSTSAPIETGSSAAGASDRVAARALVTSAALVLLALALGRAAGEQPYCSSSSPARDGFSLVPRLGCALGDGRVVELILGALLVGAPSAFALHLLDARVLGPRTAPPLPSAVLESRLALCLGIFAIVAALAASSEQTLAAACMGALAVLCVSASCEL